LCHALAKAYTDGFALLVSRKLIPFNSQFAKFITLLYSWYRKTTAGGFGFTCVQVHSGAAYLFIFLLQFDAVKFCSAQWKSQRTNCKMGSQETV
jgi:hypothetical protein